MRHLARCLAVLVITAATTIAQGEYSEESFSGNPVLKVVQLLGDLEDKVIKDGEKEQKTYSKYVEWCGKTSRETQLSIKESLRTQDSTAATISKASDDSEAAQAQIVELSGSIATDQSDLKAATLLRKKESKDFDAFDDDLSSTIQTLTRAREVLKKELKKGGLKAASFLQRPTAGMNLFAASLSQLVGAAEVITGQDRQRLVSLMETAQQDRESEEDGEVTDFEDLDLGATKATVYKTTSAPLLQALKELQEKSEDSQRAARKKEATARHNFELLKQSLEDKIAAQNKEMAEARKDKAEADSAKADAAASLQVTKKAIQVGQAYLQKLHHQCMKRASSFEEQQKERKAEMNALAQAKKAVKDAMNTGGKVYTFIQQRSRIHKHVARLSTENAQVAYQEIQKLAATTGSVAMTQLVSRLSAAMNYASTQADISTGNPFSKVIKIMQNMIAKLEDEASKESKQKAFCDKEMASTLKSKEAKEDRRDELSSRLDTISADMAGLDQALKELAKSAAELAQRQDALNKVRAEEEANFKEARQDLQDGLAAIKMALKVLRKYYGDQSDSSPLVQEPSEITKVPSADQQTTPSVSADAIMGLLEVIEADFAQHASVKEESESSSKDEYEDISQKNRIAKATIEADMRSKNAEMSKLKKKAAELRSDSEDTSQELQAVLDYHKQLTAKCTEEPETAKQRLEARRREIEGLRSALAALEGEASKAEADNS